jgi:hypothetical protein
MKITAKKLRDARLCRDAIDDFSKHWPNGCQATLENFMEAQAIGLEVYALLNLLPLASRRAWHRENNACNRSDSCYCDVALAMRLEEMP